MHRFFKNIKHMKNYIYLIFISILFLQSCTCEDTATSSKREYNTAYEGEFNNRIAFPIGGMGAGMYCIEGTGYFSHMSVRHHPDVFKEPVMFAALQIGRAHV